MAVKLTDLPSLFSLPTPVISRPEMLEAYKLIGSKPCNVEWLKEVSWELLLQNQDLRTRVEKFETYHRSESGQISEMSERIHSLEAQCKTLKVDMRAREQLWKEQLKAI